MSDPRVAACAPPVRDDAQRLVRDCAESLVGRTWAASGAPTTRSIYLLHGLGEHLGRHDRLATWLAERGFAVGGHDHLGHGASPGKRGRVPHGTALAEQAAARFEAFAAQTGTRPILFGHSMGGLLAAWLVGCHGLPVAGLVLSSPALTIDLSRFQRYLLRTLARLAPDLPVGSGLPSQAVSHDQQVAARYQHDPLVHDRVSARLVEGLLTMAGQVAQHTARIQVPVLLQVAGDDRLVTPGASESFARSLPAGLLEHHRYPGAWHEIYNEAPSWRDRALADLDTWLARI